MLSKEAKVGIMVVMAIAVVIFFFVWSGSMRSASRIIHVHFDNVNGLRVGDPVSYRGMIIGKVQSLAPVDDGIDVELYVDKKILIYTDARVDILMSNLMGGKKVEILPGTLSSELLQDNDYLRGKEALDVPHLISTANRIMDTLYILSGILHTSLTEVNKVLTDKEVSLDFRTTLKNLGASSEDIRGIAKDLSKANISKLVADLSDVSNSVNMLIKKHEPNLDTTFRSIKRAIVEIDKALAVINPLIKMLSEDKKTVIGKLMNDTVFAQKVDSVMKHLDYILIESEKNKGIPIKFKLF